MGRDNACERYTVLACTCLLTFGSYYCFDMPSVLEEHITKSIIEQGVARQPGGGGSPSNCEDTDGPVYYNLFYTVYAWCNMGMSLVAGVLVDRWGLVNCAFLFITLCLVGQTLYALGPSLTSLNPTQQYIVMFVGRFIFGLGGGSITIVQNSITAYWFAGKELAMAFGFTLTVSRLGSIINFNLTRLVFNGWLSLVSDEPNQGHAQLFCTEGRVLVNSTWTPASETDLVACRTALGYTFALGAALILISFIAAAGWWRLHKREMREALLNETFVGTTEEDRLRGNSDVDLQTQSTSKRMRFGDVLLLPTSYWIVALIICCFYNDVFPFMGIVNSYLVQAKGVDKNSAGSVAAIVYLMSACLSPFMGRAVDYFGRRGYLAIFGTSIVIPCFLLLAYSDVSPIVPMVLLGAAYCTCAAVLWPAIQFLVKPYMVGTANGIATSVQMFGIGVCNIIVGKLMSVNTTCPNGVKTVNYTPMLLFFTGMAGLSLCLAVGLKCLDVCGGSSNSRNRLYRGQRDNKLRGGGSQLNDYTYMYGDDFDDD